MSHHKHTHVITECNLVNQRSKVSVSSVSLCAEDEAPDSEEVAAAVKPAPVPVQRATKSHNASARKRSKPVSASKKRSRNLRPWVVNCGERNRAKLQWQGSNRRRKTSDINVFSGIFCFCLFWESWTRLYPLWCTDPFVRLTVCLCWCECLWPLLKVC